MLQHYSEGFASSGHLMLLRLPGKTAAFRNALIEQLADSGMSANVHYKPLPMLTAYRDLGFDIARFPNARAVQERGHAAAPHAARRQRRGLRGRSVPLCLKGVGRGGNPLMYVQFGNACATWWWAW